MNSVVLVAAIVLAALILWLALQIVQSQRKSSTLESQLTELRRDQHQLVQKLFAYTGFPTQLRTPSSLYMVYPVGRPKSSFAGKMP